MAAFLPNNLRIEVFLKSFLTIIILICSSNVFSLELNLSIIGPELFFDKKEKSRSNCTKQDEKTNEINERASYCLNPYETICNQMPILKKEDYRKSLKLQAMEFHFNENKTLLERLGIFELTNHAIIKKWDFSFVVMDTVWGSVLYALVSYFALSLLN